MNKKIIITGTTCTGKTTLGKKLSKELGIVQIDLDDFHFLPNWVEKDKETFVNDVNEEVGAYDQWIVSGSYQSLLKDSIWNNANTIVWLDYSLGLIIHRYFFRTYKRLIYKEKCCGENYETLGRVFSRNSLFLWIFKSYWSRKERLKTWKHGIFKHKNWIVLSEPSQAKELMNIL